MIKFKKQIFPLILSLFFVFQTIPVHAAGNAILEFRHLNYEEDRITTIIYINPNEHIVKSIKANFTFPSDMLEVVDLQPSQIFDSVTQQEVTDEGEVFFSAVSDKGVVTKGEVFTITFNPKYNGIAELVFSTDCEIIDMETSENVLADIQTATYSIDSIDELPQTGIEEVITPVNILILFALLIMIILFALFGFTMWGSIYLSLGKWDLEGKYSMGLGKKKRSGKQKIKSSKLSKKTVRKK